MIKTERSDTKRSFSFEEELFIYNTTTYKIIDENGNIIGYATATMKGITISIENILDDKSEIEKENIINQIIELININI